MSDSRFQRTRDRFERKRKSFDYDRDYEYSSGGGGGGGGGRRDSYSRGRESYGSTGSGHHHRRRSHSPWDQQRGKKQKQKTMTDVPGDRELFVGNIPANISDQFLLNFLNGAMRHANLCARHETPCLSCQVNASSFAFVEMTTAEMANKCLNLNGILFLNSRVKVGRPKKYTGAYVVSKTWQELTGEALTVDAVLDSESEKVNRELFVGNTTPEMTDQMLKDFLGSAMEQVGLTVMDGNPIETCEMFGKYAFIELRTPREATYALSLNNIPFMGSNLQITRPSKWTGKWETHCNWEHILAKHNMKPEEFKLGTIINPAVIAATPTEPPKEGEDINAVKAELAQVRRALEVTRRQLDESNKKSEARKEQLVSLNKKWAEGKVELTERKQELFDVKKELKSKGNGAADMDTRIEAQELRKKHEETQDMLRGVTESLVKATEKLAKERKIRQELEKMMHSVPDFKFDVVNSSTTPEKPATPGDMETDFASLRAEMQATQPTATPNAAADDTEEVAMEDAADDAPSNGTGLSVDTSAPTPVKTEAPKLDSIKEFLAKTPRTPIDWSAGSTTTPASRERSGVRLCRLLIVAPEMDAKELAGIQTDAGKYNLGGYIKSGSPGLVVVEGLEFNCDIFMDNLERQKKKFGRVGKVNERSQRAFPSELTRLDGPSAMDDFVKALESVGLKDSFDKATS